MKIAAGQKLFCLHERFRTKTLGWKLTHLIPPGISSTIYRFSNDKRLYKTSIPREVFTWKFPPRVVISSRCLELGWTQQSIASSKISVYMKHPSRPRELFSWEFPPGVVISSRWLELGWAQPGMNLSRLQIMYSNKKMTRYPGRLILRWKSSQDKKSRVNSGRI